MRNLCPKDLSIHGHRSIIVIFIIVYRYLLSICCFTAVSFSIEIRVNTLTVLICDILT